MITPGLTLHAPLLPTFFLSPTLQSLPLDVTSRESIPLATPSLSILRPSADHSAFLLGMGAVWTATQPDLLGGELTDLWPMLQSDMNNFIGNMTMLDSECSGQRVEVLQSTWEAACKVILRRSLHSGEKRPRRAWTPTGMRLSGCDDISQADVAKLNSSRQEGHLRDARLHDW